MSVSNCKTRQIAGRHLSCRRCRSLAIIILSECRYFVYCPACGDNTYLKLTNQ